LNLDLTHIQVAFVCQVHLTENGASENGEPKRTMDGNCKLPENGKWRTEFQAADNGGPEKNRREIVIEYSDSKRLLFTQHVSTCT